MIWNSDYPEDNLQANTLHTILQNVKTEIRERFEVNNGTFKEHGESDSVSVGLHDPSKVGLCGYLTDWSSRPTTNLVEDSMWFIDSGDSYAGLYTIHNNDYVLLVPTSHTEDSIRHPAIINTYKDIGGAVINCHSQYMTHEDGILLSANANFSNLTVNNVTDTDSGPIPISHASEDWVTAHGEGCINNRLIDGDIPISKLNMATVTGDNSGKVYGPSGETGIMSVMLSRNGNSSNTRIYSKFDAVNDRYYWFVSGNDGTGDQKAYFIGGVYS